MRARGRLIACGLLIAGACDGSDSAEDTAAMASVTSPLTTTVASSITTVPTTDPPTTTSTEPAPTTTEATTTTTEAATTTTVDRIAAAADYYAASATMINCGAQILNMIARESLGPDGLWYESDWPEIQQTVQPAYLSFADDNVAFVQALVGYEWPALVADDVAALVDEISADASLLQQLGTAQTFEQFVAVPDAEPGVAAAVIRAKLGLPSNINSDVDECIEALSTTTTTPTG